MFKKIILFTTFFFVFLLQPIFYYQNINSKVIAIEVIDANGTDTVNTKKETPDTRPFHVIFWDYIKNFMYGVMTGELYVTKKFIVPTENTSNQLTNYKDFKKDYTFRLLPEEDKKQLKGAWFYEVITATKIKNKIKYQDNEISEITDDCPNPIKISDIVYYFKTKTEEKILYNPENPIEPTNYPDMDDRILENNDICYEYAYKNIQSVPQGELLPDRSWNSYYIDAAAASIQYNKMLSFILPQSSQNQLEKPPSTINTTEDVDAIMHNNKLKELTMSLGQIPQKGQESINIGTEIYDYVTNEEYTYSESDQNTPDNVLINTARLWLTPQKWQDNTSIANNPTNSNLTIIYNKKNTSKSTTSDSLKESNLSMVYINK